MNPIALRLLNQQLICQQFSNPTDVVSHLGAMQAQDYRMMRWAVSMRTTKPLEEDFRKAYDSGLILRMHLHRCTWQLIAAQDYRWMLDLCGPKSLATLLGWMKSNKISIPDDEHVLIRRVIEQTIGDITNVTKEDIAASLQQRHMQMDDHRLSYHIRLAELGGFIVSGDLHPSKATYCLAAQKIPSSLPIGKDEALALLTTKYFQSRSPATLDDFVWWSGLNKGECKRGLEIVADHLQQDAWNGTNFYLLDGCRTKGFRKGCLHLLPPFDEYLIGYKSRNVVLAPEHQHFAHNKTGIFYPIIAADGVICGNWSPHNRTLKTTMFDEKTNIDLESNWQEYRGYQS